MCIKSGKPARQNHQTCDVDCGPRSLLNYSQFLRESPTDATHTRPHTTHTFYGALVGLDWRGNRGRGGTTQFELFGCLGGCRRTTDTREDHDHAHALASFALWTLRVFRASSGTACRIVGCAMCRVVVVCGRAAAERDDGVVWTVGPRSEGACWARDNGAAMMGR